MVNIFVYATLKSLHSPVVEEFPLVFCVEPLRICPGQVDELGPHHEKIPLQDHLSDSCQVERDTGNVRLQNGQCKLVVKQHGSLTHFYMQLLIFLLIRLHPQFGIGALLA